MKALIIALAALFSASSLWAQQLNMKDGSEFAVETHHTYILDVGRGPVTRNESFIFQFKVVSSSNQGYRLSCETYKIKTWDNFTIGGVINQFNSDSIRFADSHNSGIVMPLLFLQKTFYVLLSPNGKFIKTEGVEKLITEAAVKWNLEESVQAYVTKNWPEYLIPTLQNLFLELPAQKPGYQSTWTNSETNTTYHVTAIAGALLTITATAADTLKAKYTLNDVNGLLEDATITINKADSRFKQHHDFTHKIIYDKQFDAVDTAWANMAVMLSSWNKKIRPDDYHVDSATIFNYFKIYDEPYKDDPHYNTEKVSLVNQLGNFKNGIYKNLVLKTPNKFLAETELINKMNYVMDTDIDQIYDFVKFRFNSRAFDAWFTDLDSRLMGAPANERQIQFLMKEGNSREKALEIARVQDINLANTNLLLERMHNDPNPIIRQKAEAKYLWFSVFGKHKDAAFITKVARKYNKLSDAEMKSGNGIRYGVALYELLNKAGAKKEANVVLDKAIKTGERYMSDTTTIKDEYQLKQQKTAISEVLMVAYYFKYRQVKPADSIKALPYLAKAAMYSPLNFNENSNRATGPQMLFLASGVRTKQSYRREYIESLFSAGNNNQAIKLLVENVAADLGSLTEMQRIYKERFPDKKFDEFVRDKIIANWTDAPAFTAKDVTGKTYNLSDYKGKWLVLDFWGTWCPPCRAEMPNVEKFNQEINAGKHPGVVMLGMADDPEKALNRYLNDYKPTLTSVLAQELIRKYGINAVPTKCLIAPNGKMTKLPPGVEWQEVVSKLSQLYAANN